MGRADNCGNDAGSLNGLRVLVVEDDAFTAFRLARQLRRSGAQVVGPCANAGEARLALDTAGVGFALIDLRLADTFADELIGAIRQRNVPFALITGMWARPSNAEEGAVAVLLKPYDRRALIQVLVNFAPGAPASTVK